MAKRIVSQNSVMPKSHFDKDHERIEKLKTQIASSGYIDTDSLFKKQRRQRNQAHGMFSGKEVDQSQYLPMIGQGPSSISSPSGAKMGPDHKSQFLVDGSISEEPETIDEKRRTFLIGASSNPFVAISGPSRSSGEQRIDDSNMDGDRTSPVLAEGERVHVPRQAAGGPIKNGSGLTA